MNTTPITVTAAGMALISVVEVQAISYIVIAAISLVVTIVTTMIPIIQKKHADEADLKRLEDLKKQLDDCRESMKKSTEILDDTNKEVDE